MSLKTHIFEKIKNDPEALKVFNEKVEAEEDLKKLAEYFNINPNAMTSKLEEKQLVKKIKIANDLISESYSALTPLERTCVDLIESKNKTKVYNQLRITETFVKALKPSKEKDLAVECLKTLKSDIVKKTFKETVERTMDLKGTVLESLLKEAGEGYITKKLGSLKYLKNIEVGTMYDEKDAPETLYVSFDITFYPLGKDFTSVRASALDLDKRFHRLGKSILRAIREVGNESGIFAGTGIWDGSVRTNGINPGKGITGSGEMAIHLIPGSISSVDEAKKSLIAILKSLDALIPTWFPEIDKTAQKAFKKNPDVETADKLATLKRQTATVDTEPERVDDFGGQF